MRKVLLRYTIVSFFKSFLSVFLCFCAIIAILESMEIVRKYYSAGYSPSFSQIAKITFFKTIVSVTSFFSFVSLLSTILFFTLMHNRSEIIIIKGSGVSTFDMLKTIFIAVAVLGVLYISIFDSLSVYSYRSISDTNAILKHSDSSEGKLAITKKAVWLRDQHDKKSYIISATGFDQDNSLLHDVKLFEFDSEGGLKRTIYSTKAIVQSSKWIFGDCSIISPDGTESKQKQCDIPLCLSFLNIEKMMTNPKSISFWDMRKYIKVMENVGLAATGYILHWLSRLATIFQMFAFTTIATAFCITYYPRNFRAYMVKIAMLMSLAFPIHFINNVVIAYGESGKIPLPVSAFIVPFVILFCGMILVEKNGN